MSITLLCLIVCVCVCVCGGGGGGGGGSNKMHQEENYQDFLKWGVVFRTFSYNN